MMTLGMKANLPLFVMAIHLKEEYKLAWDRSSPGAGCERQFWQRKQVQLNTGVALAEAKPAALMSSGFSATWQALHELSAGYQ